MPLSTPEIKVNAVKSYGAKVILHGDNFNLAKEHCEMLIKENDGIYIPPYDHENIIAGNGTIGKEILEKLPITTHIFVPIGGGGIIAGILSWIKFVNPEIKVIGVESKNADSMFKSINNNNVFELELC